MTTLYRCITEDDTSQFCHRVSEALSRGWSLHGTPSMAFDPQKGVMRLAQAVERLKARSSRTTVLIDEGDLTRLLPRLRLGELDVFVGRLEPAYASPDLETEPLYQDPMVAVARPAHPLVRKRNPTWADIAAQPCGSGLWPA